MLIAVGSYATWAKLCGNRFNRSNRYPRCRSPIFSVPPLELNSSLSSRASQPIAATTRSDGAFTAFLSAASVNSPFVPSAAQTSPAAWPISMPVNAGGPAAFDSFSPQKAASCRQPASWAFWHWRIWFSRRWPSCVLPPLFSLCLDLRTRNRCDDNDSRRSGQEKSGR
jgi:hypothetical protein